MFTFELKRILLWLITESKINYLTLNRNQIRLILCRTNVLEKASLSEHPRKFRKYKRFFLLRIIFILGTVYNLFALTVEIKIFLHKQN